MLGLLLAALASPGVPASAQPATASPPVSLGFGPSSLLPASGGSPVYTAGETVWAESGFSNPVNVSVVSPGGPGAPAGTVAELSLQPDVVAPLYTFTPSAPEGLWNVTFQGDQGPAVIPVRLVNPADHRPGLQAIQYSLQGGNLSITAQASSGGAYDQELCAEGSGAPVTVALPRDMGDIGTVSLTPGTPFDVLTLGSLNESLSFWFELYQTYALDQGGTSNLVSYDLRAAQSQPIDIAGSGPVAANLTWDAPLRAGRYDLRAFFENSTSVEVFQSRVLVLSASSWVPLSGACPAEQVQSSQISYTANLTAGPGAWPRTLYYMYRTSGVEAVASFPLKDNLSSLSFVALPWNEPVDDANVSVTSSAGVVQTSQDGGSLYILASGYPAQVNYSLEAGGTLSLVQRTATFQVGYSTQTVKVSLAQLDVRLKGAPAGPTIRVTGPDGMAITRRAPTGNGTLALFLPAGSYTVTASQGSQSQSSGVELTDGVTSTVTLDFNALTGLETALVAVAFIAAAANVAVWTMRVRARPKLHRK